MKLVYGSIWIIGDMIPVDMVVNCILAASVNAAETPEELKGKKKIIFILFLIDNIVYFLFFNFILFHKFFIFSVSHWL